MAVRRMHSSLNEVFTKKKVEDYLGKIIFFRTDFYTI